MQKLVAEQGQGVEIAGYEGQGKQAGGIHVLVDVLAMYPPAVNSFRGHQFLGVSVQVIAEVLTAENICNQLRGVFVAVELLAVVQLVGFAAAFQVILVGLPLQFEQVVVDIDLDAGQ